MVSSDRGEKSVNLALYHLSGKKFTSETDADLEVDTYTGPKENLCRIVTLEGTKKTISYAISSTTDETGHNDGIVLTFRDVTERHESVSRMSWLTSHDDLTQISNRREVEKRIVSLLEAIKRGRKRIAAFLYMDLDQFKIVNDTCGHEAGDLLLKQVSRLLNGHIRQRDTLGRLGGDEFGIILEDCPLGEAECIAEKIRSEIEHFKFPWKERLFRIGISIGVVEITDSTTEIAEVLSNADAACYAAKNLGRNRVYVHTKNDADLERQREERNWVTRIHESIENDHLTLHIQKIVPLSRQNDVHWEVLLRMYGKKGDLIFPGSFLPAAERFGLVKKLDFWVINHLFSWLKKNYGETDFIDMPRININLSGASFNDSEIVNHIQRLFEQQVALPEKLVFEITESSAILNFASMIEFIDVVKKLGCKVALDDFGTGMSSFSYLQKLKVDFLKIDGSFIRDIDKNDVSRMIVKSIVEICRSLDIETVAEYAESPEIVEKLKSLNVDWVQGYEVGRPVSMDSMLTEYKLKDNSIFQTVQ